MATPESKTALRMIPYALYLLTAEDEEGNCAAAAVTWVTQASFQPPLLAVGVKKDSAGHELIKKTGHFALNMLGKEQKNVAFSFFKPVQKEGNTIGGEKYHSGQTGAPVFDSVPAFVECKLIDTLEHGDHSVFLGEVVHAGVNQQPEGRPDEAILWLKDLGDKLFYGG